MYRNFSFLQIGLRFTRSPAETCGIPSTRKGPSCGRRGRLTSKWRPQALKAVGAVSFQIEVQVLPARLGIMIFQSSFHECKLLTQGRQCLLGGSWLVISRAIWAISIVTHL